MVRCLKPGELDPYLLLWLLNSDAVKMQIPDLTFVQATLSTIGDRLSEVVLPIPRSAATRTVIARDMKSRVDGRAKMREEIRGSLLVGTIPHR